MNRFSCDTILFATANYAHARSNRNGDHDYGTALSAEEKRNLIKYLRALWLKHTDLTSPCAQRIRNPLIRDIGQNVRWAHRLEAYVASKANVSVPALFCHVEHSRDISNFLVEERTARDSSTALRFGRNDRIKCHSIGFDP